MSSFKTPWHLAMLIPCQIMSFSILKTHLLNKFFQCHTILCCPWTFSTKCVVTYFEIVWPLPEVSQVPGHQLYICICFLLFISIVTKLVQSLFPFLSSLCPFFFLIQPMMHTITWWIFTITLIILVSCWKNFNGTQWPPESSPASWAWPSKPSCSWLNSLLQLSSPTPLHLFAHCSSQADLFTISFLCLWIDFPSLKSLIICILPMLQGPNKCYVHHQFFLESCQK